MVATEGARDAARHDAAPADACRRSTAGMTRWSLQPVHLRRRHRVGGPPRLRCIEGRARDPQKMVADHRWCPVVNPEQHRQDS